jgi:pilus assembly protein CpaD
MRNKLAFLLLASVTTGACSYMPGEPVPQRGVAAVNVPVVSRADYSVDLAAPGGSLPPSEEARLDSWFRGLQLGYGDSITLDGPMADVAVNDVARVAGRYGLLVSPGAPVTTGAIPDGAVRVVVSRTRASVPGCPDWSSQPGAPNYNNEMISGYDPRTATRAVNVYRSAPPTGKGGLDAVSTTGGN